MDPVTAVSLATTLLRETGLASFLGKKLAGSEGQKVAEKVTEIASAITGTSDPKEMLEQLRQDQHMQQQLRLRLLEIHESEIRAEAEDRASARAMQVAALAQDDVFSKRFVYYLAIGWSVFVSLYIVAITFLPIPEQSLRFADATLSFLLGTIVATMISYFYGSSQRNKQKDEAMNSSLALLRQKVGDNPGPL